MIEEMKRELSEKQAALTTVIMKIADVESLVEEVADSAYEKACEVVADTVRAETQKEDLKAVEDYKKWLASPERKAPQEKRDFAVKCLNTIQEQIRNATQKALKKVRSALQKPEVNRANKEQIKTKARESVLDKLTRGKIEADRLNWERMEREGKARQAAEMYGIRVNRSGMALCPFHDDKYPSMKADKRFHCFGCQADGDVIDFVVKLYGLNNLGVAMKLAADFGISYDNKRRASPRPVKRKLSEELRFRQAELQCRRILSDYSHLLEKWKIEYAPKEPEDEWHPLFMEALQKQACTEYMLNVLLTGTVEEKAAFVKDYEKEVMRIGERISGLAARHKAGRDERSGHNRTGTDCR